MPNIIDYLECQFATFDEKPFNVVDAAVLSQICMVNGKGIIPPLKERQSFTNVFTVLRDTLSRIQTPVSILDLLKAEYFPEMFTGFDPERTKDCLFATAASPRFRAIRVQDYLDLFDTRLEMQFAAMTFVHKNEFAVITFRGTDSTITGWKEDFNMAFSSPVPAQEQALHYLTAVAGRLPKRLIINGHSKGGNLAEYVALKAPKDIQDRIEVVYNLDGPGFKEGAFTRADYEPIIDRICKVVPEDSIIGILLNSPAKLHAVVSKAHGFSQHSVFNWEVALTEPVVTDLAVIEAPGEEGAQEEKAANEPKSYLGIMGVSFEELDGISSSSEFTSIVLKRWLAGYSDIERKKIVEAVFDVLDAAGADDVLDLLSGGPRTITLFKEAASNLDEQDKDLVLQAGRSLVEETSRFATERMGQAAAMGVLSGAAKLAQAIENATANRKAAREAE